MQRKRDGLIPNRLATVSTGRSPPILGEGRGAGTNLVPREAHPATPPLYRSRDVAAERRNRQRPPNRTQRGYCGTAPRTLMSSRHPRALRP